MTPGGSVGNSGGTISQAGLRWYQGNRNNCHVFNRQALAARLIGFYLKESSITSIPFWDPWAFPAMILARTPKRNWIEMERWTWKNWTCSTDEFKKTGNHLPFLICLYRFRFTPCPALVFTCWLYYYSMRNATGHKRFKTFECAYDMISLLPQPICDLVKEPRNI